MDIQIWIAATLYLLVGTSMLGSAALIVRELRSPRLEEARAGER